MSVLDDTSRIRLEIEHLETWYYVESYFAPFLFSIMALALVWSIIGSMQANKEIDTAALLTKGLGIVVFVSGTAISRYVGKQQRNRAEILRKELTRILRSMPIESMWATDAKANHSAVGSVKHLFSVIYLPTAFSKVVWLALFVVSAIVGTIWIFVLILFWDVPVSTALLLMTPMICLLFFLFLLYQLAK
jgi:hypothetical protein